MVSYDDVAKSIVTFVRSAAKPVILPINKNSKFCMMNVPDSISDKSETPLCVVRMISSEERVYRDGTDCPPTYANINIGCIILGDTFTVVQKIKNAIMQAWRKNRRISLYRFAEQDNPIEQVGTILNKGESSTSIPGELRFPVREVDSITFSIRVKMS